MSCNLLLDSTHFSFCWVSGNSPSHKFLAVAGVLNIICSTTRVEMFSTRLAVLPSQVTAQHVPPWGSACSAIKEHLKHFKQWQFESKLLLSCQEQMCMMCDIKNISCASPAVVYEEFIWSGKKECLQCLLYERANLLILSILALYAETRLFLCMQKNPKKPW